MSQVPTSDWSFTQFEDDGGDQTVAAPPPAKKGRLDLKAAARQKVDNFGAMLEATRFLFSALEAHAVCAEQELKKLEAKKPRAKPAAAGGGAPAPAAKPSKAAAACEEAVVSKPVARHVKRVRTAAPEAAVAEDGGDGGAGAPVHYYPPQAAYRRPLALRPEHTGVHTGV